MEIVREELSNAIRHGHARQVMIDVTADTHDTVEVLVTDDGVFAPPAASGLGSSLLDEWCIAWERSRTDTCGTLLHCRVVLDPSFGRTTGAAAQSQPV